MIHPLTPPAAPPAPLYEGNKGKYKALKDALADDLIAYFAPMRERYEKLKGNERKVDAVLKDGAKRAQKAAERKLAEVRKAIGVR